MYNFSILSAMRKAHKTVEILTALAGGTLATLEILDELLPNYQKSYKNAHNRLYGSGFVGKKQPNIASVESQKFYSLLNQLKRQGLIEKKMLNNNVHWKITGIGIKKLKLIQESIIAYPCEKDGKLKIVVYDIPEKERMKRLWLHEALKVLDFKMLQKSVYIGKNKIPETFLLDLQKKNIIPYVHVLEVSKSGTVKELI